MEPKSLISLTQFAMVLGLFCSMSAPAEVRLAIAPTGHVTVPVKGEFGTQQFVFDTGAEGSAVYAGFADSTGLRPAGTESLQGQTGVTDVPFVELRFLELDDVRKGAIKALKLPKRADGSSLAGIVGLDVFGDRTVDFDLTKKRLSLLPPGERPHGLQSQPMQASTTIGMLLTVPIVIGDVTATAVIDTGARKTRFNWALGKRLGWDPNKLSDGDTIQGATNKPLDTRSATVPNVQLGDRRWVDAPALVADLPVFEAFGVADRPAIILGLDWLEDTRMVIDFPARLVWFEPSETAQRQ